MQMLKSRLKQKDETVAKYQDMLKLARDEILNINKQHELEINNMMDKLNLTRDTNLQKLKHDLSNPVSSSAKCNQITGKYFESKEKENLKKKD